MRKIQLLLVDPLKEIKRREVFFSNLGNQVMPKHDNAMLMLINLLAS